MSEVLEQITKKLEPGQWRVWLDHGYDVQKVSLMGLRKRPFPLMQVDYKTYCEKAPPDENGKWSDKPPFVLRGIPVCWHQRANCLMLWPLALHAWTLQIEMTPKVKA